MIVREVCVYECCSSTVLILFSNPASRSSREHTVVYPLFDSWSFLNTTVCDKGQEQNNEEEK